MHLPRPPLIVLLTVVVVSCVNPFAPGLDTSPAASSCDPTTIEGVFRCFQTAYTFRDTSVYGRLLDQNFIFVYRDHELGVDVTFEVYEWSVFLKNFINARHFVACILGWGLSPDPDDYQIWHSSQIEKGFNFVSYKNPEEDRRARALPFFSPVSGPPLEAATGIASKVPGLFSGADF